MEAKISPRAAPADGDPQTAWLGGQQGDGLTDFFAVLRRSRWLMTFLIVASIAASVWIALNLQPYWRVEIVVMPVNRNDPTSLNSVTPSLAGLAPLIGRQDPLRDEAMAVLRSRELFDSYAKDKNLLPLLFEDRWDPEANAWKVPPERVPTLRTAFRLFDTSIRDIEEDRRSGIVTLALTWKNREQAVTWARDMIELANKQLRTRALDDAERNMRYLTDEMRNSNRVIAQNALTNALAGAYEKQLQNYMFAKGQDEYAFRIIDRPTVPDERERVSPKRTLIVVIGLICGIVLGIAAAYAKNLLRGRRAALRSV